MGKYGIWYKKNPTFNFDPDLYEEKVIDTYKWVTNLEADNLEDVFCKMQAENWSPNGEARSLIEVLGLHHTSMSVGDVAEYQGFYYQVDHLGWRNVPDFNTLLLRRVKNHGKT